MVNFPADRHAMTVLAASYHLGYPLWMSLFAEPQKSETSPAFAKKPEGAEPLAQPEQPLKNPQEQAGLSPEILGGQKPKADEAAPLLAHYADTTKDGEKPSRQEPPRVEDDPDAQTEAGHHHGEHKGPTEAPQADKDDKDKGAATPTDMTGIATTVSVDQFVKAAKDVQKNWESLKTEERAAKISKAANDELKTAKVPETTSAVVDIGSAGQLSFSTWELKLGQKAFSAAKVTDAEAADVADTVYHESRHAEQWHRMARLQAGKGKKADEITKAMGIPARIAKDAVGNPLTGESKEAKEADSWYESVYGGKSTERNTILKNLGPLREARQKAQEAYDKIKNDPKVDQTKKDQALEAWKAAYTKWKDNYDKYRALPEEADAWKVGDKVTAAYTKKESK